MKKEELLAPETVQKFIDAGEGYCATIRQALQNNKAAVRILALLESGSELPLPPGYRNDLVSIGGLRATARHYCAFGDKETAEKILFIAEKTCRAVFMGSHKIARDIDTMRLLDFVINQANNIFEDRQIYAKNAGKPVESIKQALDPDDSAVATPAHEVIALPERPSVSSPAIPLQYIFRFAVSG